MTANELPSVDVIPSTLTTMLSSVRTANGQVLSPKEDKFVTFYIETSDPAKAAMEAGYSIRETIKDKEAAYLKKARKLLSKDYIQNEISARLDILKSKHIADTEEVLMYLTRVMRGEEKDQFGLDVSIQDRTAAAKELNRRMHEIEHSARREGAKEVHVVLERSW